MSAPETPTATPALIERRGIEIVPESERTARPRDLFWPWFAANVSVFGISYAAWIYNFGVSFVQGLIVAVIVQVRVGLQPVCQ